jgi:hypothetical protein
MNAETEPLRSFLEQKIEATVVCLIEENWIAGVATQDDVVEGSGIVDSGFTGHVFRVDENV